MKNQTHKTKIFDTEVVMVANWSQPASQIWMRFGDSEQYCTGKRVAEFGQKYHAMRHFLEEYVVECGDDPDAFEKEIDAAIESTVEYEENEF